MQRIHRPIAFNHNTPQVLRSQGFVDVQQVKIRLPVGEWSRGHIDLGRWWRLAHCEALEAYSLAPFTRPHIYNWPVHDVRRFLTETDMVLRDADIHAYNDL